MASDASFDWFVGKQLGEPAAFVGGQPAAQANGEQFERILRGFGTSK